jgi:VWFA-related protein
MAMGRVALVSGVLVALAASAPSARQAGQATPPVFRSAVDHVAVDVVVTDGHNQPLTNLTKDDFEIVEQGRRQTVADFEFVSIPATHHVIDPVLVARAPKIDVATNIPPSPTSRAFVMVIDDLHIVENDITFVKRIITEFVQSLAPDDEAAIIFTSRSDLSVDLTQDVSKLVGTADHVRDALGFGEDALGATTARGQVNPHFVFENARRSDFMLQNVAASLAGSRFARRAIIYVSSGSVTPTAPRPGPTPTDFFFLKDVYDAAHRADVPIYTLDPRGLVQPEQAVRGGIGALGGYGLPDASGTRRIIASNILNQQDRLRENAAQTGGRAFVNQNDLPRAVDELIADNDSFYVLGYYPEPFAADGKFHPISVKVTRPGAHVRARAGYVASAAADVVLTDKDAAGAPMPIDRAMGAGVSVADVSLRAVASPIAASATGLSTVVTVEVTYPVQADGPPQVDDDLQLRVLALDPDGKVKAATERVFHVTGLSAHAPSTTFQMNDRLELPTQALVLRIGVSSRLLGKTGTVQIGVEVPKPSDDKLQIGGVVLGVADGPASTQAFDVIHDLVPFQPTTERTFTAADTVRVFAPVFWSGKDASATVTVSVPGVSSVPARTVTVSGAASVGERHWQGTVAVTLPLAGLAAGRYGLAVDVRLPNGQTATRQIAFAVR